MSGRTPPDSSSPTPPKAGSPSWTAACSSPGSERGSTRPGGWPQRRSNRTLAAILELVGIAADMGADAIRVAGTSAVREAANRQELQRVVEAATGLTLEVVPGEVEAALSFRGATGDLPPGRYLVC